MEPTTRCGRRQKAAADYKMGRSRRAYRLRKDIQSGMKMAVARERAEESSVCSSCASLLDLRDIYRGLVHSGQALRKRRAIYPKPGEATYQDIKKQNKFLMKTVFDGTGNYIYHRNCVHGAFSVGAQRLARLRKAVDVQTSEPIEYVAKESIAQTGRLSDVVMPIHCEQTARAWVESQPDLAQIPCRKQPTRHGNARKRSNHSKSNAVLQQFLDFVDKNSASNGRKEGSHGKTFYFNPKFTQIRTPNKDDPQYSYKCKRSVL